MHLPGIDDAHWMRLAVALAACCPRSATAYAVGAVIVGAAGDELARGWSREHDEVEHAEESALAKIVGDARLATATLYSSLEPCAKRASRPRTCAELILDAGISRVVTAWREPAVFVANARGTAVLEAGGVEVVELPEFAAAAMAPNAHLPLGG